MEISWYSDMKKLPAGVLPDSVTNTTQPTVNVKPVDVVEVDVEPSGADEGSDKKTDRDADESEDATKPAPSAEDANTQLSPEAADPPLPEHGAICDICRVCSCFQSEICEPHTVHQDGPHPWTPLQVPGVSTRCRRPLGSLIADFSCRSECTDFDLCQACMDSGKHPASHRMLRLNTPRETDEVALSYGQNVGFPLTTP
jgi:hypothetical protein